MGAGVGIDLNVAIKQTKELIESNQIRLGMTRQELKEVLGEPTDWNVGTRKYPKPMVYKYQGNDIEFTFEYHDQGGLVLVFYEDPDLTPHIILKEEHGRE